ncbi:MAG: hypothetical protein ACXWXH_02165 [Aeromicrobium sp.]
MPNFDADVVVVGSGFGGATTALRLTEAGRWFTDRTPKGLGRADRLVPSRGSTWCR